jgi:hypothetical protein
MTFITQHPLNRNVKQEKLSFSINGGMSIYNGGVRATTESRLSVSLLTTYNFSNLYLETIQNLYKRGSMSFPHKLTNGVKSPSLMLIERPNYNDGNFTPNREQIHFVVNLLMVTLSPACAKAQFVSSSLSSINAWITPWILEEKMRGRRLSFLECAPRMLISWRVLRWSDAPAL